MTYKFLIYGSLNSTNDACSVGRIAIAIHTAPHGDIHRIEEVAISVYQPHIDIGAIDPTIKFPVSAACMLFFGLTIRN